MSTYEPQMTLDQARRQLLEDVENGAPCPCCTQLAKVYRRRIHHTLARSLITLYRLGGTTDWIHVARDIGPACELGKARYWGLVEEQKHRKEDGGRSGWWRMTEKGGRFVRHEITVPTYARIYDGRCLNLVGPKVSILECLPVGFRYDDLMAGV